MHLVSEFIKMPRSVEGSSKTPGEILTFRVTRKMVSPFVTKLSKSITRYDLLGP